MDMQTWLPNGTSIFVLGNTIKSREESVSLTVSYSIKTE